VPARTAPRNLLTALGILSLTGLPLLGGCIYHIDVQQGNLLDQSAIDQVKVGMTRSQVEFLLGTPTIIDPFHDNRWDYPYYFRQGHSRHVTRRWVIVYFDGDKVVRLDKDATVKPES
jgi:outer membrane protein assembly factor BamE